MKHILMIATGGTIASRNLGKGLEPAVSSEELLACVPELADLCRVSAVQPFCLDSTNICAAHWLAIARIIENEYDAYDGFVVTHGTDTMAYTAAALSYLVQNSAKPIVLTGAQRSVYMRDTDARRNLVDAFAFCAADGAFGVHIVFNGSVILGTRAKKTRTRSFNAFSSVDFPAAAIVRDGVPFFYLNEPKPQQRPVFSHAMNRRVFVLKMFPGMQPDIFDYLDRHCDGIVVEAFGTGGLPDYENDAFLARFRRFLESGKTAVLATQVEREGSALDTYAVGRKLSGFAGLAEARCMTLEAALTKLMWVLASARGEEAARRFLVPVAHDIY